MEPSTRFRDLTVAAFVDRLASAEPVPGGGSAAAVAASLAAGLVAMVASLSQDRPKYEQHAALHAEAIVAARELVDRFLELADEDAVAYAGYVAAMKLPRDTEREREVRTAAIAPGRPGVLRGPVPDRRGVPSRSSPTRRRSPAGATATRARTSRSRALLSVAASRAAAANVYINLPSIGDEAASRELYGRTEELADEIERLADTVREVVRSDRTRDPLEATGA